MYIDRNPIHHNYVNDYSEWGASSYRFFISNNEKSELIDFDLFKYLFENQDDFVKFHSEYRGEIPEAFVQTLQISSEITVERSTRFTSPYFTFKLSHKGFTGFV